MNQIPEIKEGLQFTVPHEPESGINTIIKVGPKTVLVEDQDDIRPMPIDFTYREVQECFQKGIWVVKNTPTIPISTLFSSQPHNVVMTALEECAKDDNRDYLVRFRGEVTQDMVSDLIADYLESTPKTSLVTELVDKIHQLGFTIIPK